MAEKSDPRLEEILARHKLELDRLKDAFGLLGVSACSWCKKFFRRTDPGSLFDAGNSFATPAFTIGGITAAHNSAPTTAKALKAGWSSGCAPTIMPNCSRTLPNSRTVPCKN
jgi:hypothetical protein